MSVWAQEENVQWNPSYTFTEVQYPHDTFTQLLGINNGDVVTRDPEID
jgi:hypothetical protein